ncbi:MAG: hypothetical protein ACR2LX_14675 [Jatrophihabitans sp.]
MVDASSLVDLLLDNELGRAVRRRIGGHSLHAPAHLELPGTWARRHQLRLVDALYAELAISRRVRLVTTDIRLRTASSADLIVV